ncbi:hypothetical protein A0H81_13091 [Grifola frondosa]|uniref:DUF6534 domain-containing protein n=1 Tax=Grifola frondosa TaxID=5627 RepID=A0A1C7LPR6_GRIFR|nr:hypothetical protein A0H81_13091 [Grifola frondosa]
MSKPAAIAKALNGTIGANLLGVQFQMLSYGVLCACAWRYAQRSYGDSRWFKGMIFLAWCICTFSLCLTSHALYTLTITNFLSFAILNVKPWSVNLLLVVNASVVVLVRLVFVYRLWRLCKSTNRIGFVVVVGVTLTIMFSLVDLVNDITIRSFVYAHRNDQLEPRRVLFEVVFFSGLSADILLTVLLCVFLNGSRTGLRRTDSVINILILYAIETGLFPSIIEGAGMVAFYVRPGTFIFVAFYIQIANLYLIALLTSQVSSRAPLTVTDPRPG